jgi:hypothetical protein
VALDLAKDPEVIGYRWLRLRQGDAVMTGAFVLATGAAQTVLAGGPAREAGFRTLEQLLEDGSSASDAPESSASGVDTFVLDSLELNPGVSLKKAWVRAERGWRKGGLRGTLGADVWGHFQTTIDLPSGVLLLRRSAKILLGGPGAARGAASEKCFNCSRRQAPGLEVMASVWRDLPEGARLHPMSWWCRREARGLPGGPFPTSDGPAGSPPAMGRPRTGNA